MSNCLPIEADPVQRTLDIPHWGVSMRTLYGAALGCLPPGPAAIHHFTVRLKGAPIATLNVQTHNKEN